MNTAAKEIVDPAFFTRLDNLELRAKSIVEGFTLTGGSAAYGAGVQCDIGAQPSILRNWIVGNHASYDCGNISCDGNPGCSETDLLVVGTKAAGVGRWGH